VLHPRTYTLVFMEIDENVKFPSVSCMRCSLDEGVGGKLQGGGEGEGRSSIIQQT